MNISSIQKTFKIPFGQVGLVIQLAIVFVFLLLIVSPTAGQQKSALPADFFASFNYTLPLDFNYQDTAQVIREVKKLAIEINNWHNNAKNNYSFADSSALYNFLDRTISAHLLLGNHQEVVDAITTCRQIRRTPEYAAPYRLSQFAYSASCLLQPDDGSPAFRAVYAQKLVEQFELITPAFKNDVINQQKGIATPTLAPLYWKNLLRLFNQALTNNNGNINYNNAQHDIIPNLVAYLQLMKYQPLVESVLYSLSPARVKEQKVKIAMRDGKQLSALVYLDEANKNATPAIISLNPYPAGGWALKGNTFAINGYAYVHVDARGRGESEGDFVPFQQDASDYYDIIDWVSKQPWCNGQVATTGGSYLGFAQWQSIRSQYKHPALKAINPMVSVGFGVDFPRLSNRFYSYILRWATYVTGKELNHALFNDAKFWNTKYYEWYKQRLPFAKLDSVAGLPNAIFQQWISHPEFDAYWKSILPTPEDYRQLEIPVLSISGYYDGDQLGALYYYHQHQKYGNALGKSKHHLLIGPYDHGGAQWLPGNAQNGIEIEENAQIPIYKYVIWWFDWVLKGQQKPAFIKDAVTYFETGNNKWEGAPSFKQLTSDSIELFLSTNLARSVKGKTVYALDASLSNKNAPLKYSHDISSVLDSAYLFVPKALADSMSLHATHNLVFESKPLAKDVLISDKIISKIYCSLNVPDADFEVNILEIAEDGKISNLANGKIRVRYRNGGEKAQLVKPAQVVLLQFEDVLIYVKKINRGSKIRLVLQSVNDPWNEKNYGFGGEVSKESTKGSRLIEASIYMSKKYPSKLVIPVKDKL